MCGAGNSSTENDQVWKVNVDGTRNIVDLCEKHKIAKFLYVSSVHAIQEIEAGQMIKEETLFSASKVKGIYGKSKAEATAYVLKAAERGLSAMVVHPSGMISSEDFSGEYMTEMVKAYLKGYFPCAIEGGYDFVDVRDVADGILKCIENGKAGETYILSNEYITVRRGRKRRIGRFPINISETVYKENINKWMVLCSHSIQKDRTDNGDGENNENNYYTAYEIFRLVCQNNQCDQ